MEQPFDDEEPQLTRKRSAEATDSIGGEAKRLRVEPLASGPHFDLLEESTATSLECASGSGGDVSFLMQTEDTVDQTTEPTPSPSSPAPSSEPSIDSITETTDATTSISTPEQKQPDSVQCDSPSDADSSSHDGSKIEIDYDTCFAVILAKAVSSTKLQDAGEAAIAVSLLGSVLKLSFRDTGKYLGIITSETLAKAVSDFSLLLTARILPVERPARKDLKGSKENLIRREGEVSVRVLVHGLMVEKDAVGNFLSDHDLFFQHPLPGEYDSSVPYLNPQYLLRPGSQMPDLGQLSLCGSTGSTPVEVLDDVAKARLMRIFDLACDTGTSIEAKPSPRLKSTLQRHQLSALAMMTEKECNVIDGAKFPTLWEKSTRFNGDACFRHRITGSKDDRPWRQSGGLLADEMGLGKTLSVLALICWSLDSSNIADHGGRDDADASPSASRTTLIVTPKSTLPGWQEQIKRHIHKGQLKASVFYGLNRGKKSGMMHQSDVVFTTYETLRSDWQGQRLLHSKPWLRVVLDEAHHIRTRSTQVIQAACAIKAEFRWCLTGTPIQNSLDDYGSLISFIGVRPFASKSAFDSWITSPLKRKHPTGMRNLEDLVKATCLRRTKLQVKGHLPLPPRVEEIEWIDLSPADRDLYEFFKAKTAEVAAGLSAGGTRGPRQTTMQRGYRKGDNIICLMNVLRLICGHGEMLLPESALEAWQNRQNRSIDWQTMQKWRVKPCDLCRQDLVRDRVVASADIQFVCRHLLCPICLAECEEVEGSNVATCPVCGVDSVKATSCSSAKTEGEQLQCPVTSSNKVLALVRNIGEEQQPQAGFTAKSVVFSCWTKMLDLTQQALEVAGFSIVRIDGQKSIQDRARAISRFRDDSECTVMLASIGSAGEGIDLTSANHVHLLEPNWNPMVEAQALDRVHRIGQRRPVKATRYITRESIETYVQWVQNEKIRLINQSLDLEGLMHEETEAGIDGQRWSKLQECLSGTGSF